MRKPLSIVTGGAEFIGSHMVELLLDEGHRVRVVDNFTGGHHANLDLFRENPDLSVEDRDMQDLSSDAFEGADYVFHFAGIGDIVPSIEQPVDYMDVNVKGR